MMKTIAIALALALGAEAFCPNACSGNGRCAENDKCVCYANFQGVDCSERTCPFSTAWSTATGDHAYAECGNRGTCDRGSGTCECHDGYIGKGCAREVCPEDCSGHGTCETLTRLNSAYTGWDSDKIRHCKCDPGYSGLDCSSRLCPVGDDPLTTIASGTTAQTYDQQTITIAKSGLSFGATDTFTITYRDWRNEHWTTWALPIAATGLEIEEALEALPNHAIPNCTVGDLVDDDPNRSWLIEFVDPANSGTQSTLSVNIGGCTVNGCQPWYAGVASSVAVTTRTRYGTTENAVCSNRGVCNTDDGVCECVEGYKGRACEKQTIIM